MKFMVKLYIILRKINKLNLNIDLQRYVSQVLLADLENMLRETTL